MTPGRHLRGERLVWVVPLKLVDVTLLKPTGVMPYPEEAVVQDGEGLEHRTSPLFLFEVADPQIAAHRAIQAEIARLEALPDAAKALSHARGRLRHLRNAMVANHLYGRG
jgi:hypothetical protein